MPRTKTLSGLTSRCFVWWPEEEHRGPHGTSVAAPPVGRSLTARPGLIRKRTWWSMSSAATVDERASVASLVKALDLLAMRGVRVINMSLVGPPNVALEATLARLNSPGAVVLAAAGNGGPGAEVADPAGYPSVLAITAVDFVAKLIVGTARRTSTERRQGSRSGAPPQSSGSRSRPAPRLQCHLPLQLRPSSSRDPDATPEAIATRLRGLVRDVGSAGPDEVFGAGLLQLDNIRRGARTGFRGLGRELRGSVVLM